MEYGIDAQPTNYMAGTTLNELASGEYKRYFVEVPAEGSPIAEWRRS